MGTIGREEDETGGRRKEEEGGRDEAGRRRRMKQKYAKSIGGVEQILKSVPIRWEVLRKRPNK